MNNRLRALPAKFQILIFLLLTFLFSWSIEYVMIRGAGVNDMGLTFLLMWTPGICGILCAALFKDIGSLGFKWGNLKSYALAYGIPAATAMLILGLLIATKEGSFNGEVSSTKVTRWFIAITVGVLIGSVSALGEEIGWRGFLQTKFQQAGIRGRYLWLGIIWAIWHWPLILFSNYATSSLPALSLLLFTICIVSFAVIIGWLKDISGSVFVAALAHGAHNLWIQFAYPVFLIKGPRDEFFGGESGLFNAAIYLLLAIYIYRKKLRQLPTNPV
ncbi:CPBP family intramembrane glutamic endopeptidase [Bdellovibrio sp. NC01]|uniref:CPBP family intramembrane glutamic endopeptidase n=1 Tax=Bdellovibrio sp. NC01 TaxID=2220073 RepID=UPI001158B613|nr:CPBP family intramembrane glutamic endopeptidase [Bdellovibrio sp. NC01]